MLRAPIFTTLDDNEIAIALAAARHTAAECAENNRKDAHGYDGDPWEITERGAYGEMAFCKAVGIPFRDNTGTFKGADYGKDIQVKLAQCRKQFPPENFGNLIYRPGVPGDPRQRGDNPAHKYVLVVGNCPHFVIKGWIIGYAARRDEWFRAEGSRPGAWWVPYKALNDDLDELLKGSYMASQLSLPA